MHVFTVNKKSIQKSALLICCALLLAVSVYTVGGVITGRSATTGAKTTTVVENTGDMVTYILGFGLEVDVTTARLENGRIPKKFDDSFVAFNEVVMQGGGDLADYKNKKIEKWSFAVPALSEGDETAYAVLIVYKEKVVGSYILMQPSGEVLPINTAVPAPSTHGGQEAQQDSE